jgi:hypothetical protein
MVTMEIRRVGILRKEIAKKMLLNRTDFNTAMNLAPKGQIEASSLLESSGSSNNCRHL